MPSELGLLPDAMRTWRSALGLEAVDAVSLGQPGISVSNWSRIENGHTGNYRATTFSAIDRSLSWPHGTARGLADGTINQIPALPESPRSDSRIDRLESELAALKNEIKRLARLFPPPAE